MRAALLIALLLTGCATPAPERVLVPVPVPCRVELPAEPAWATDGLPASAPLWDLARALLAERQQRIGYEAQLRAALESCNGSARATAGLDATAL